MTIALILLVAVAFFIAGVCERNRVIEAVRAAQAVAHSDLVTAHSDIADAILLLNDGVVTAHKRISALEVTLATRVTAVEDSIKAKLP